MLIGCNKKLLITERAVVWWGRGGNPRLTFSCIRKGESTFTPSGNKTTQVLTIRLPDMSANQIPAVKNHCDDRNHYIL